MTPSQAPAWRREIFDRYARERRAMVLPSFRLEVLPDLTRHWPEGPGGEAVLSLARFPAARADDRIAEELASIRARGCSVEWKVHDFDEPPDLKARLEGLGLGAHHEEALMVMELGEAPLAPQRQASAVIEEARGDALDELAAFQEAVWRCPLPWLAGVLRQMSDPRSGTGVAYCARIEGRIVGSGWIDFHGGSTFAQLCGGAVAADVRGRGIYSMLFERRLQEAHRRRVPFIAVDAAPMSRPILERKGFRFVCHTFPMRARPL